MDPRRLASDFHINIHHGFYRNGSMGDAMSDMSIVLEALEMCRDYFDKRADSVDGDYGIPEPNKEMVLWATVENAIKELEKSNG
jgi:hypothetical protein